jgi:hypothetical protein
MPPEWSNHDRTHAPHRLPRSSRARGGILVTLFMTVRSVAWSRDFYTHVLRGSVVLEENPCLVRLSNSWILTSPGGANHGPGRGLVAVVGVSLSAMKTAMVDASSYPRLAAVHLLGRMGAESGPCLHPSPRPASPTVATSLGGAARGPASMVPLRQVSALTCVSPRTAGDSRPHSTSPPFSRYRRAAERPLGRRCSRPPVLVPRR